MTPHTASDTIVWNTLQTQINTLAAAGQIQQALSICNTTQYIALKAEFDPSGTNTSLACNTLTHQTYLSVPLVCTASGQIDPSCFPAGVGGGVVSCSNVTACLNGTDLQLNSLTVAQLFVTNVTQSDITHQEVLSVDTLTLNGSMTCAVNTTIDDTCLPLRIATINVIPPYSVNKDFVIVGGPGIAISGLANGLMISNTVNVSVNGEFLFLNFVPGNLSFGVKTQMPNHVLAGPPSGMTNSTPHFRYLVEADIPLLNASSHLYGILPVSQGGTGSNATFVGNRFLISRASPQEIIEEGPLLGPGQFFTGDGMGGFQTIYLGSGNGINITNYPNGTVSIASLAVHAVNMSVPSIFNVTSGTITDVGTLSFTVVKQSAHTVWAGPTSGSPANPTFRLLQQADIPQISLFTGVTDTLPVPSGGTNNPGPLAGKRLMVSDIFGNAIVEFGTISAGQILVGTSATTLPVATLPTGTGGISVTPGVGTLMIGMTSAPTFTSLSVSGTTTLGNATTCSAALDPSCLSISNQACPLGALSTNCIPTSGLHLSNLIVDNLVITNTTTNIDATTINATSLNLHMLNVEYVSLNNSMTCTGNGSVSQSCYDISNKMCPFGSLDNSCVPANFITTNGTFTNSLSVNHVVCTGGPISSNCISIDSKTCTLPIDDTCTPLRVGSINGITPQLGGVHDFSVLGGTGIQVVGGTNNITLVNTLLTTSQTANTFFAAPDGVSGFPSFRSIVTADLPGLGAENVYFDNSGPTNLTILVQQRAVSSVSLSLPGSVFSVSGSPVGPGPSGGTLTGSFVSQTANTVFAAPNGTSGTPSFRTLTLTDLPPTILSVALTMPPVFQVSNSPLTGYGGTLAVSATNQSANTFWAGPTNGSATAPSFRTLAYRDFQSLSLGQGQVIAGTSSGIPTAATFVAGANIAVTTSSDGLIIISAAVNGSTAIGTVVDVGVVIDSIFSVSPAVITTNGTFNFTANPQGGHQFYAGPGDGTTGVPTFRDMVLQDMPPLGPTQMYYGDPVNGTISVTNLTAGNAISITTSGGLTTIASTMSVGLSLPASVFSVSGSPVTSTGALTATLTTQSPNTVFAGPSSGMSALAPTFRALVAADLPPLGNGQIYIGNMGLPTITSLSAGSGITITPGPGTLTITATDVSSINMVVPTSFLSVSGGPITTVGTFNVTLNAQSGNSVFASPADGSSGLPVFRGLVSNDIPTLDASKIGTGVLAVVRGGTNSNTTLLNNRVMVSSGNMIVEGPALLNGQLLVGVTGGTPTNAFLTAGVGISIVNVAGGITVANTGVTSVGLTLPASVFMVANSPVTTTGTLAVTFATQSANTVFAGPASGGAADPAFRGLVQADIPSLDASVITTGILPISVGGTNSGTALNNNRIMVSNGGSIVEAAALTNGELLIGSNGSAPVSANIGAGTGISIVNGPGSITVFNTGVTSVALAVPAVLFSVSGSPVTTTGTLNATLNTQVANSVFAGPTLGGGSAPTFRLLVAADVPSLDTSKLTTGILPVARGGTNSGTTLVNNRMMVSSAGAIVEAPQLLDGQVFIGNSSGAPIAANLVAGSNIVISYSAGNITISTPAQNGTDTSVGLALPGSVFSISGSPVTTAGVLTGSFVTQTANMFFAGPSTGVPATPTFRGITLADLPTIYLNSSSEIAGILPVANGGTNSGTALVNNRIVVSSGGQIVEGAALTDGQLFIGSTGAMPVAASLTAGTGISIIQSAGNITITSTLAGGTVTSVGLVLPGSVFSVGGSPVTMSGTLTGSFVVQNNNTIFAGPTSGAATSPTFRAMVVADLPTGIPNANLANAAITINGGTAISGGSTVSLGSSMTLSLNAGLLSVDSSPVGTSYVIEYNATAGAHNLVQVSALPVSLASATGILSIAQGGTNSGTALLNNRIMVSSGGAIVEGPNMTNGQILIGSTNAAPSAATLTAGTGINIVNGAGTISIANTGVTSVALTVPSSILSVSGSPVTTTGTLAVSLAVQSANTIFAGPTTGSATTPTFRSLVLADLSALGATNGQLIVGSTGAAPVLATPTAGNAGITIGVGAGSLSISNAMSVGLTVPSFMSVSGSPLTGAGGTLGVTMNTQLANTFLAGPFMGSAATPTFRQFNVNDFGMLSTNGTLLVGNGLAGHAAIATLTAGSGISIANAAGSITISATGTGTVTSVNISVPTSIMNITNNPITTSGTMAIALTSQTANTVFCAPDNVNGVPTFRSLLLDDLPRMTNGQLYIGQTGGVVVASTLSGTPNQVTIGVGAGSITLSTPQNIHTAATPTFASQTLSATTNQLTLGTTNTVTLNVSAPSVSRTYSIADPGANANFVMDTGGPLTITNAGSVGQVLVKATATTATWQTDGNTTTSLTYNEVSNTTDIAAFSSASYTVANGMSMTLAAGMWNIWFSTTFDPTSSSGQYQVAIFNGASVITHSQRPISGSAATYSVATHAVVTSDGSSAITIQWQKTGGSGSATMHFRTMFALRVA